MAVKLIRVSSITRKQERVMQKILRTETSFSHYRFLYTGIDWIPYILCGLVDFFDLTGIIHGHSLLRAYSRWRFNKTHKRKLTW